MKDKNAVFGGKAGWQRERQGLDRPAPVWPSGPGSPPDGVRSRRGIAMRDKWAPTPALNWPGLIFVPGAAVFLL